MRHDPLQQHLAGGNAARHAQVAQLVNGQRHPAGAVPAEGAPRVERQSHVALLVAAGRQGGKTGGRVFPVAARAAPHAQPAIQQRAAGVDRNAAIRRRVARHAQGIGAAFDGLGAHVQRRMHLVQLGPSLHGAAIDEIGGQLARPVKEQGAGQMVGADRRTGAAGTAEAGQRQRPRRESAARRGRRIKGDVAAAGTGAGGHRGNGLGGDCSAPFAHH